MKKFFQMLGLISLTCFSFFITGKTATVVNNMDDIMVQIKQEKDNYKTNPVDAYISGNTIIPGINGKEVNINKSYKNMKINGYYSEKLYVYDYEKPKISLENNKDKYIIRGNKEKRMVSLIFRLKGDTNIDEIVKILDNYNAKSTFFVDPVWFNNNSKKIEELIHDNHNIGILLDDYKSSDYNLIDTVLKNVHKQKNGYCYNARDINICSEAKDYTIRPIEINSITPLLSIKENIDKENLFSLEVNRELKKEISSIIIYIKSKGYTLENLDNHIIE